MAKPRWRLTMVVLICGLLRYPSIGLAKFEAPAWEGLATQIVPLESQYKLGQPMRFRVQIVNMSHSPVAYHRYADAYARYDDPVTVQGPDGRATYLGPWNLNQEMDDDNGPPRLQPGATLTLFEFDLSGYYYIEHPGRYTLQYRGGYYAPTSAWVSIDVLPGTLPVADEIIGRVIREFSSGWTIEKHRPDEKAPEQFRRPNGIVEVLLSEGYHTGHTWPVDVWQVSHPITIAQIHDEYSEQRAPIEYLGQNRWGAVYARDALGSAKGLLPRVKDRLMRAMEISTDRSRQ